jgi:hypothetical protein
MLCVVVMRTSECNKLDVEKDSLAWVRNTMVHTIYLTASNCERMVFRFSQIPNARGHCTGDMLLHFERLETWAVSISLLSDSSLFDLNY